MTRQATPRQVRKASRQLARFANTNRLHAIPFDAKRFVSSNGRVSTVRTGLLAALTHDEINALLRSLAKR